MPGPSNWYSGRDSRQSTRHVRQQDPPWRQHADLIRSVSLRGAEADEPHQLGFQVGSIHDDVVADAARERPVRRRAADAGRLDRKVREVPYQPIGRSIVLGQCTLLQTNAAESPKLGYRHREAPERAEDRLVGVTHDEHLRALGSAPHNGRHDRVLDPLRVLVLVNQDPRKNICQHPGDLRLTPDQARRVEEDLLEIDLSVVRKVTEIQSEDRVESFVLALIPASENESLFSEVVIAVPIGDAPLRSAQLLQQVLLLVTVHDAKATGQLGLVNAVWLQYPFEAEGMDRPDPQLRRVDAEAVDSLMDLVRRPVGVGEGHDELALALEARQFVGDFVRERPGLAAARARDQG